MSDINRSRMIPLHVCDQAVANCEAEIEKLKHERIHDLNQIGGLQEENARLKAEVDDLRMENQAFQRTVNEASAHYDNRLADISRLKAEVERLTAFTTRTIIPNEELQAQVERLTKAGDAMASSIQFNEEMAQDYNGPTIVHQSVQRWNAAKEGKQP